MKIQIQKHMATPTLFFATPCIFNHFIGMLHPGIVYFNDTLKFFVTALRLLQADCDNRNHEGYCKTEPQSQMQSNFHISEHVRFPLLLN